MESSTAFVLLDSPTKITGSTICQTLKARHPEQPLIDLPGGGDKGPIILNFAGAMIAVMQIDVPLPSGWEDVASRAALYWPEATAIFSRHRAHLVVSPMGGSESPLQTARALTAAIGAIVASEPQCSGIVWNSTVANSSEVVADLSQYAFAPYPDFPTALWVSRNPFRALPSAGVLTLGLQRFIGREIEIMGNASQLEELLTTTDSLIAYFLERGGNVRDGDTFGISETEKIPMHLVESRRFNGWPVISIRLPS